MSDDCEPKAPRILLSVGHSAPHSNSETKALEEPLVACDRNKNKTTKIYFKSPSSISLNVFLC